MSSFDVKWLWMGAVLEIVGLLIAAGSVLYFHRLTMLALFVFGLPALALGMACYLFVVLRYLAYKGAL